MKNGPSTYFILAALAALFLLSAPCGALATTWTRTTVECQLCKTPNTFGAVMTYGGYVYQDPSKFEYVYFPKTETRSLYCCSGCGLCLFMGDFDRIPATREAELKKAAAVTKAKVAYAPDGGYAYARVPIEARFEAAEKVYQALEKDDESWCDLYRTWGYHMGLDRKKKKEAAAAREKALKYAESALKSGKIKSSKKELYYICGAMKKALKDKNGALEYFKKARDEKFVSNDPKFSQRDAKGFLDYFDALIAECIKVIENPEQVKKEALAEIAKAKPEEKRSLCMHFMRTIDSAYREYHADNKKMPDALDRLFKDEYLPEEAKAFFVCPESGTYSVELNAAGDAVEKVKCSKHGEKTLF